MRSAAKRRLAPSPWGASVQGGRETGARGGGAVSAASARKISGRTITRIMLSCSASATGFFYWHARGGQWAPTLLQFRALDELDHREADATEAIRHSDPNSRPLLIEFPLSIGRLVSVTYGSGSAGSYQGYDQLGRVSVSYQQTDSQNYGFGYGYNLANEMTSETYPSGR